MSKEEQHLIEKLVISENGSLGLLALGSLGLKLWREKKREAQSLNSVIEKKKNGKKK
jgi:hypothetical protein